MSAEKKTFIKNWILGSSSKWRQSIFAQYFQSALVEVADIDEKAIRHPKSELMTQLIARAKADAIINRIKSNKDGNSGGYKERLQDSVLICCDQVVRFKDEIREKPETRAECRKFLQSYREYPNDYIECINGICVYFNGRYLSHYEITAVKFKNISDSKIEELIEQGNVMTCAGGFTISCLDVAELRGSVEGIEGLPVKIVRELGNTCANLCISGSITHCIFNIDGLLLNTDDVYMKGHQEVCKRYGAEFTFDINHQIMGMKSLQGAQKIIEKLDIKEINPRKYEEELTLILATLYGKSAFLPGAETLLYQLKSLNIPMIAVTSSCRKLMTSMTSSVRKQFEEIFYGNVICGDDIPLNNGGPISNIYQQALQKLLESSSSNLPAPKSETVMVFESSPIGVKECRAAGMNVIMVPNAQLPEELRNECTLELESLENLDFAQFL